MILTLAWASMRTSHCGAYRQLRRLIAAYLATSYQKFPKHPKAMGWEMPYETPERCTRRRLDPSATHRTTLLPGQTAVRYRIGPRQDTAHPSAVVGDAHA